jgi:hypothetical protein
VARVRAAGEGGAAVPAFVAAEKPDRLRLEALDFFGNPVAVLVAADGRLAIYDARERAFYRGAATPANVGRLVPVALPPAELVALLCGAPPLAGEAVEAAPGRGHVTLDVRDGARRTTLRVRAGAAVEWADVRDPRGGYEVAYGEPRSAEGALLPGDLVLSAGDAGVRVEVVWVDFAAEARLDPALFRLDPPPGARVVDLDAGEPALPAPLFEQRGPPPGS